MPEFLALYNVGDHPYTQLWLDAATKREAIREARESIPFIRRRLNADQANTHDDFKLTGRLTLDRVDRWTTVYQGCGTLRDCEQTREKTRGGQAASPPPAT